MEPDIAIGIIIGFAAWFVVRCLAGGIYTVNQNERAVKTSFGRAARIPGSTTLNDPISATLDAEEKQRYNYPEVRVIMPGGPYFKMPWQKIYKVSVATQTVNMAFDPDTPGANKGGTIVESVTKDQLNTGLVGQLRFRVSEQNLYAYMFGVKRPIVHIMGYFISVLRQRIASFTPPATEMVAGQESQQAFAGVSINELRKNLRQLNESMDKDCLSSAARYGIVLDASLITGIDPPTEVESALAAINTAHNSVAADISLAQASADQKIVQSKRAVEIETLNAQAEVEPLVQLANQLAELKKMGNGVLRAYLRNVRLSLFGRASQAMLEVEK